MTETILTAIVGHMIEIFFLIASILVLYLIRTVKVKLSKEQQDLLTELVRSAILYVQQAYPGAMPQEKLTYAVTRAAQLLEDKGLKVNEETLIIQIESNLKDLKLIFGDEWKPAKASEP